ncbi:MAG: type II toxin-antitoxin system MqsA family antitoxin [Actinobacteria bacterium]|nr:type II toxin-antitoxin system MqsA family antitoxin [Actinomycetota bacterium]
MSQRSFEPPKVKKEFPRLCPICGGSINKTTVTLSFPDDQGSIKIVQGVPAGVCSSCGEEYLTAEVSLKLERILSSPPHSKIHAPVWKYAS